MIGGARAAKIQKTDMKLHCARLIKFMRSMAKTELYITHQIKQEKPIELQGT